ncbi:MAG TPA: DUF4126 domain-containing protein [Ktedonobacterales bacterium]|jgi:hypothetical protein|nr:DUF4126 domain-containing protein [Ktedonobacterales bacterium]
MTPLDTITNPFSDQSILALIAALGLSSTAGLRAVATLFAIGIVSDISISGHPLLELHGNFAVLGSTPVLILLGVLTVIEIIIDKFPGLDHVNDIIHTVIRPVVGAVIVAGTSNTLSDTNVWVAAAAGAVLAFGVHATKSTTRVATTATTAGIGNPVISTLEDLLTFGSILLVVLAKAVAVLAGPVVGIVLLVIAIVIALIIVLMAWRISVAIVRVFRPRPIAAAAAVGATVPFDQPAE